MSDSEISWLKIPQKDSNPENYLILPCDFWAKDWSTMSSERQNHFSHLIPCPKNIKDVIYYFDFRAKPQTYITS